MLKGIHLTLMIGPAVPKAAPYEVMEALTNVEVRIETNEATTFQLDFQVGKQSKLDEVFMLSGLSPVPVLRVILIATVNGQPNVLVDGVVTKSQYAPALNGLSQLRVQGEDLTRLMSFQDLSGIPFPALPAFARVALILAKYSPLGILPKVVPNIGSFAPNPLDKIPRQQGTDLQYVRMLACTAGYEFYLEPTSRPGISTAYWGPTIKYGAPQPALSMNMDAFDNVESLNFEFNSQDRTLPIALIQEPNSKIPVPIPVGSINPLNPPMGRAIPLPTKIKLMKRTSKMSFAEAAEAALAEASKSADVASANGTLDVLRYGRLLEARKLVGVRGSGTAFNGTYYVKSVTHKIKRGEYKQDFVLTRNALVALKNRVSA